jgi:lipoate-protein ligase A
MVELSIHDVALDDPARASALAATALERARRRSRAFLCSYVLSGDVLALGRFHVVPAQASAPVALLRRVTGGRLAPLGEGYVALLLALPQGRSLARDDPPSLPPERILNRAVRGLLGALERVGVQAYYPGRDVITVGGRTIGVVGIEVAPDGAVLVEACVALARSFAEVARFADRADPSGVVPMDLASIEQATSVATERGRALEAGEWQTALAAGYTARLDLEVTPNEETELPLADPAWLDAGRLATHLDRHATARDMLGVVEVYAARDGDHVRDVRLCGDIVGPSSVVIRLESALRGAPVDRDALRQRAGEGAPEGILGIRSVATIADLVYEACA